MYSYSMMEEIKYKVVKSKRKTVSITINSLGEVIIKAPHNITNKDIKNILDKRKGWILKNLDKINSRKSLSDDEILYLGKIYKVRILIQPFLKREFITLLDEEILISLKKKENEKAVLVKWFKSQCEVKIKSSINKYLLIFNVLPKNILIKDHKSKWGSCTYDNRLNFNYRLIMAPEEVLEYVVVHELCHMVFKNHSKEYWDFVKNIMPNYKINHDWLKENGYIFYDIKKLA